MIKLKGNVFKPLALIGAKLGFVAAAIFLFQGTAYAIGIATVATTVTAAFGALITLIKGGAYIAGTGFVVGSIMKFKQHKDNPTQIPIGTPVALLFVGASLLFLPTLMEIAGTSLFGEGQYTAGFIPAS